MSAAHTLRAAAAIIERQPKLCQKFLHDPDGNYCMLGAVLRVLRIDTTPSWAEELNELPEVQALGYALDEFFPRFSCVSNWNDKPGRTAAEAAEFLRHAADLYEYTTGVIDLDQYELRAAAAPHAYRAW